MFAKSHLIKSLVSPSRYYQSVNSCSYRLLTLTATKNGPKTNAEANGTQTDVSSVEQSDQTTAFSDFVEPTRIQSLNILANIETMEKPGSVFNHYFLGSYDKDLLNYPFLLRTRKEFLQMNQQYDMVRSTWNKIQKNDETLDLLGFNSLHKLSVSEMMYIFEAIGASIQKQFPFGTREDKEIRYEKKMAKSFNVASLSNRYNIAEMAYQCFNDTRLTLDTVVPLILRNSLVYYSISQSSNPNLKDLLLDSKHNIGFALCEPSLDQSSDYLNWNTEAKLTYDLQSWVISGEKCKIVKADYSHYLLFCRTDNFTEKQAFSEDPKNEGIVAVLIPADQVEVEEDGADSFGIEYQKIKLRDVKLLRESCEVIKSQQDLSPFFNVKGCGQLASSAVILGLLKQLLKNTYAQLVNERIGLANSELVQYKLYQATSKIYALESMLYMTAAMFDSFEKGTNMEGESITVKTLTTEYAYSICHDLRNIFGSRFPFSSTVVDLIYSLDSFLDSSLQNRIWLGQRALSHYKDNSRYHQDKLNIFTRAPVYSVKYYLKYRKLRKGSDVLTKDMNKYIHHNMHSACDWIESCINRLEYSSHLVTTTYEKDFMERHVDLNRLASIGMDIFMMIAVLSRANHSLCYGLRNNDTEKELCLAICKETFLRHLALFEDLNKETMSDNDTFAQNIFSQNLKENGYFASLFRM